MVRIRFGLVRFNKAKDKILRYSIGGMAHHVQVTRLPSPRHRKDKTGRMAADNVSSTAEAGHGLCYAGRRGCRGTFLQI